MEGKITRIISNLYTVTTEDKTYDCRARGKFRNDKIIPLVGDNVVIDEVDKYILEIKETALSCLSLSLNIETFE